MNKLGLTLALYLCILLNSLTAQYCVADRFASVEYFSNSDIQSLINVTYGNAPDWQGNNEVLELDYYFPKSDVDSLARRPFIQIIHGGRFTGGDKANFSNLCIGFAKRGFVVSSINYRLGFSQSDSTGIEKAIYRAQQDANAALRFSVELADSLGIDTAWIFTGGASAGSITSILTHYADEVFWDSLYPGIVSTLGPLKSSGNSLKHSFDIKALYNNCGASISGSITNNKLIPMVSFHGLLDTVVPIDSAENGLIGSRVIHNVLGANGICNDFTIDTVGYHCPHPGSFTIERTACFFKSLFCSNCTDFYSTSIVTPDCSGPFVSIFEANDLNSVSIYPNPFHDKLKIKGVKGNELYYLYDYLGRTVYEGTEIQNQNFKLLASGPYTLVIRDKEKSQSIKVFKN